MSRRRLANIVISCDAIIVIIFVVNIMWMNKAIGWEQHDVGKKFVHMTDFTVRVKNLPLKPAFDNLDELKAMLEMHIMEVIKKEPNVYQIRRD